MKLALTNKELKAQLDDTFSTFGGDIGSSVKRMPVACSMAARRNKSEATSGDVPKRFRPISYVLRAC